jgi:hypothetical protein
MGSVDDGINLSDLRIESFSELELDGLYFFVHFLIELPLFNEIAVDSDDVHFFFEGGQFFDFGFNLLCDIDLRKRGGT